jgi:endonuclease I
MNVSKDDEGGITLDSSDHSISFSWNRITTPPTEDEKHRNDMIKDVMNTPTNTHKKLNCWNKLYRNIHRRKFCSP